MQMGTPNESVGGPLVVRDLTLRYESGGFEVTPVRDLSFTTDGGELVLLLGASGCGKTSLLSALASLLRPTQGSIRLGELEVTELRGRQLDEYRRTTVGVVFQAFNLIASLSALDNVAMALWNDGWSGRRGRARARELLAELDLDDRARHLPGQLSGGQQQRVAIARALALQPRLVLADEPTAHLDHVQVEGVLRHLRRLASEDRIVVIATHDERLLPLADRVVELSAVTLAGPTEPIRRELTDGEVLFEEGDVGQHVFVVERGAIELMRATHDDPRQVVARIAPGQYFGELAPLYGTRRSASARAIGPTTVVGYGVHDFRRLGGEDGLRRWLSSETPNEVVGA